MDVKLEKLLVLLDIVVALLTGSIRERVAMDCSQEMEILASREVVWVVCRVLCIWQRHAVLLDSYHSMTCVLVMEYRSHRYHSNQSKHQSNAIQCNPMQSNAIQSNPIQCNPIQCNPMQRNAILSSPNKLGIEMMQQQRGNEATTRHRDLEAPYHITPRCTHTTLSHSPTRSILRGKDIVVPDQLTHQLTHSLTHL